MNGEISESTINYEILKRIEQHAKQYEFSADKKEFLRNISAYEQKLILLQTNNPYEVLSYLDELDLKRSRLILEELKSDEIKGIIDHFSSEDKKIFYATFSDLDLVNQFIVHDKNADEYITDLSFDRKVDLIDASDLKTIEATSKVYESMPYYEREVASSLVTESNAISALSNTNSYQNDNVISEFIANKEINLEDIKDEKVNVKAIEEIEKEIKDPKKNDQNQKQIDPELNEFFKSKLKYYIENIPEFAKLSFDETLDYSMLSDDLKQIIITDFELSKLNKEDKEEQENELEKEAETEIEQEEIQLEVENLPEGVTSQTDDAKEKIEGVTSQTDDTKEKIETEEHNTLDLFQNAKQECELAEIERITNVIQNELINSQKENIIIQESHKIM